MDADPVCESKEEGFFNKPQQYGQKIGGGWDLVEYIVAATNRERQY